MSINRNDPIRVVGLQDAMSDLSLSVKASVAVRKTRRHDANDDEAVMEALHEGSIEAFESETVPVERRTALLKYVALGLPTKKVTLWEPPPLTDLDAYKKIEG